MNPDVLLNRIRLEQRGLIDIHKKLYEMEHLLPAPDPMQFAKTAESAALLSEKSTAACGHLIIICEFCSLRFCRIKRSGTAVNSFCCHYRRHWCKADHFPISPIA